MFSVRLRPPGFVFVLMCLLTISVPRIVSGQEIHQSQIILNEIHPNPLTGAAEAVEIYNVGTNSATLSGWSLRDQLTSPTEIFHFTDQVLEPGAYFVAEISGKLNNIGDGVALLNSDNVVVDEMSYTSSTPGMSWCFNPSSNSYVLTEPSLGSANILPTPSPVSQPTPTPLASPTPSPPANSTPINYTEKVAIYEVMSCPAEGTEWFKIVNLTDHALTLEKFFVLDQNNNRFEFTAEIDAHAIEQINLNQSILNNTGDSIHLYDQGSNLIQTVVLSACQNKGQSFILINGIWSQPSSGLGNDGVDSVMQLEAKNMAEKSDVKSDQEFDLSTTNTPEQNQLNTNFDASYLKKINSSAWPNLFDKAARDSGLINQDFFFDDNQPKKWPTIFVILGGIAISSAALIYFYEAKNGPSPPT